VTHSRTNAALFGAAGGAVIALATFALAAGRSGLHALVKVDGDAVLQVTSGALYLLVLVVGLLGGLLIGGIGYAVGTAAEPDSPRFPLRYLLPVSALVAAILAYAVLRLGVGGFGDIAGGLVTVGVLRMSFIVLVMGAAAGGTTSGVVTALSRPDLFAFEGEAWPSSAREVMAAMLGAVSAPLVAAVLAATFAIPLSLVLIELEGDAAVVTFAVVGAIVLGGATLIAARPWDKDGAS
jgi:hypothetical protein